MAAARNLDFVPPADPFDTEDEATLAAIDEGVKAADEGRVVPAEEVRKLLPQWISKFSTPSPR
jgi:predicted transcriptional regulator